MRIFWILAIGYLIGILTAPKSGKEMREDIKGILGKSKEKISDVVDKTVDKTKDLAEKGKNLVEEIGEEGK
jgi:gas vesicle protein